MKQKQVSILIVIYIFLLTSCAKIFHSPDSRLLASKHKTIAIVLPSVSIAAGRKIEAFALIEQQKTEAINFQKEIYAWFLKRKMQSNMSQEIQDIETTNARLQRAGYPKFRLTTEELCELLDVDGIINSNFSLSKPMSLVDALIEIFNGNFGPTNEVHVSLSISDCTEKKLIWNYDHKYSGGLGSSPARLVDGLMRNASKKMPYVPIR
jgi:hypothetical protein